MSVSVEGSDQDFDLNIAPIIDCFTVLIAYMLISASFISIGFFDVGVSTTSEVSTPTQPPEPKEFMSVALREGQGFEIKLSGPESAHLNVPARGGGGRDTEGLLAEVRKVRARWPSLGEVAVSGDAQVEYREIIGVIEALKKEIPKVFVGE